MSAHDPSPVPDSETKVASTDPADSTADSSAAQHQVPAAELSAPRGMSKMLAFWVAILLIGGGGMLLWTVWRSYSQQQAGGSTGNRGWMVTPPEWSVAPPEADVDWVGDFVLTERSGKPFRSEQLAGKVWVTSFFFASCPSSCIQQNKNVKNLAEEYGPQGVTFVSITVDPERDTPERLREYARDFQADPEDWLFLTGNLKYVRRIGVERFLLPVNKQMHPDRFVVLDKWGNIRGAYDWHDGTQLVDLKRQLDELLQETEPPAKPESDGNAGSNAADGEPADGEPTATTPGTVKEPAAS